MAAAAKERSCRPLGFASARAPAPVPVPARRAAEARGAWARGVTRSCDHVAGWGAYIAAQRAGPRPVLFSSSRRSLSTRQTSPATLPATPNYSTICTTIMTFDVKGKFALVTGGATGIGLAYVKELLRNGVAAVAVADLDDRKGENSVKELITEFGSGKAIFIKCDVTKPDELKATFTKAAHTFKGLDIVINNAGILDDSRWELEVAINVTAVARGTWFAFDIMGKDKGGRGGVVANIASILGLQPMAGCPVYVATKHAVVGLSRSFGLPYHFDRTGVKVVTMCPGVTDTPLISEAHHRQFTDDLGKECGRELDALPKQQPENVAKGMLHIIRNGGNGSVWVSEGGKPVYEVAIPERETIRVGN